MRALKCKSEKDATTGMTLEGKVLDGIQQIAEYLLKGVSQSPLLGPGI